jgi:hypothetical protein
VEGERETGTHFLSVSEILLVSKFERYRKKDLYIHPEQSSNPGQATLGLLHKPFVLLFFKVPFFLFCSILFSNNSFFGKKKRVATITYLTPLSAILNRLHCNQRNSFWYSIRHAPMGGIC